MSEEQTWTVAKGELEGRLAWLRMRRDVDQVVRAANPHLLVISWPYEDDGEDGMPPSELKERFTALEEKLTGSLEEDQTGLITFVLTTAGARRWHIYSSSAQGIQDSVNKAFAEMPGMPISLTGELDPDWNRYSSFRETLDVG